MNIIDNTHEYRGQSAINEREYLIGKLLTLEKQFENRNPRICMLKNS